MASTTFSCLISSIDYYHQSEPLVHYWDVLQKYWNQLLSGPCLWSVDHYIWLLKLSLKYGTLWLESRGYRRKKKYGRNVGVGDKMRWWFLSEMVMARDGYLARALCQFDNGPRPRKRPRQVDCTSSSCWFHVVHIFDEKQIVQKETDPPPPPHSHSHQHWSE